MKMGEVYDYVQKVKPNVYDADITYLWLNTVDGIVAREVMGEDKESYDISANPEDIELLVPHPYDDIYALYVSAMVDFHNREYEEYNNTVTLFRERLEQYKAWYIRKNPCCDYKNFRNVMG